MSQFDYKRLYRRKRPHLHPPGSVLFITFRLFGSIPRPLLEKYRLEKIWLEREFERLNKRPTGNTYDEEHLQRLTDFHRKWFTQFESVTDKAVDGPMWLGRPEIRDMITEKLIDGDEDKYRLDAHSIMSNHVHVVLKPHLSDHGLSEIADSRGAAYRTTGSTLSQIMQGIKGSTARSANNILDRSGSFWETESYDHVVRSEAEFYRVVGYTLNNPVKAGLVKNWRDWPGNYLASRLQDML